MQTGFPSPTPVQQAPCSPITRRTGRCPNRLQAKSDELRPQEPLPLRQSRHRLTSLTTSRIGTCYSNRAGAVKDFIPLPTCADKLGVSAHALFTRSSRPANFGNKIRKKRSCACQSTVFGGWHRSPVPRVARMKRSAMRGSQSRISLRSIRATCCKWRKDTHHGCCP
jgi:hypothetical protein